MNENSKSMNVLEGLHKVLEKTGRDWALGFIPTSYGTIGLLVIRPEWRANLALSLENERHQHPEFKYGTARIEDNMITFEGEVTCNEDKPLIVWEKNENRVMMPGMKFRILMEQLAEKCITGSAGFANSAILTVAKQAKDDGIMDFAIPEIAWKATLHGMKCHSRQYKLGEWAICEGGIALGERGIHFTKNPATLRDWFGIDESGKEVYLVQVPPVSICTHEKCVAAELLFLKRLSWDDIPKVSKSEERDCASSSSAVETPGTQIVVSDTGNDLAFTLGDGDKCETDVPVPDEEKCKPHSTVPVCAQGILREAERATCETTLYGCAKTIYGEVPFLRFNFQAQDYVAAVMRSVCNNHSDICCGVVTVTNDGLVYKHHGGPNDGDDTVIFWKVQEREMRSGMQLPFASEEVPIVMWGEVSCIDEVIPMMSDDGFQVPKVAWKVTKSGMRCKSQQYKLGKWFVFDGEPKLHRCGFHYTEKADYAREWSPRTGEYNELYLVQVGPNHISGNGGKVCVTDRILFLERTEFPVV